MNGLGDLLDRDAVIMAFIHQVGKNHSLNRVDVKPAGHIDKVYCSRGSAFYNAVFLGDFDDFFDMVEYAHIPGRYFVPGLPPKGKQFFS